MKYNLGQIFQFVAAELDKNIKDSARPTGYAGIGDPIQLLNDPDLTDPNLRNRVTVSLLHLLPSDENVKEYAIMVFSAFKNYELSLLRLSQVQIFFEQRQIWNATNLHSSAWPDESIHSIQFAPFYPSVESLRDIWSVRGNRAFPAAFFTMRIRFVSES